MGDTLYEWCDERICFMKCSNWSAPLLFFRICLVFEHYTGQYQTNNFVGGSFYNYVGAKNKTKKNDQWQWQTVQIQIEHNIVFPIWVCTVCSLHFLTKLRYAVYGIFIEIICLNKCSTNMGGARTARPCRPIGTHVDSFVFILRLSNTQFKNK